MFGGLLGSLYGDLPAPKSSTDDVPVNLPSVPPPVAPVEQAPRPEEVDVVDVSDVSVNDKPLAWVADRAQLLLLQPVARKREALRKQNNVGQPAATETKGAEESPVRVAEESVPVRAEADPRQPLVAIVNEYDPSKPNSYDDYMRTRMRNARKKEEDARRLEEMERIREEQKKAAASTAAVTSNLNVSGEEAWKRRGQITAAMFGHDAPQPEASSAPETAAAEKRGFAQKMLEKMGWKHGEGLGREKQGILAPLVARKTDKRSGVIVHGASQPQPKAGSKPAAPSGPPQNATRIILLHNLVGRGEVDSELEAETADEAAKYGNLLSVKVVEMEGVSEDLSVRIFCEYDSKEGAFKALNSFNGRLFGGRTVRAQYFDEAMFAEGQLT